MRRDELEAALFTGRCDAGDAVLTVNAGAGGTDAQDWAEVDHHPAPAQEMRPQVISMMTTQVFCGRPTPTGGAAAVCA